MTTTACEVRVWNPLKSDPLAVHVIDQAMEYLASRPGFASLSLVADWRASGPTLSEQVELQLTEYDHPGHLVATRVFPRRHLFDPVLRDLWALRVFGDLMSLRTARNQRLINEMVQNLGEEFADGGSDDGESGR